MIFEGRNRVRYGYSRYGWTRSNGKTWHGGLDIEGMDNATIRMPSYAGKTIAGTVVRARIVTDKTDKTWEWGWYVTVRLDAAQTPDAVNYLIFAHCKKLLVKVGQKVRTGDALAVMGNTGNAALADPPFEHVHFECRAGLTTRGLDPTAYAGIANETGTYNEQGTRTDAGVGGVKLTVKTGSWYLRDAPGTWGVILGVVRGGTVLEANDMQNGWYHTAGGWLSGAGVAKKEDAA
ncbi:MAG: peptidoglycan DD-metalloendopeptidase family protein [Gemmiger sp.]